MLQKVTTKAEQERTLPAVAQEVYESYLRGKTMYAIAQEKDLARATVKRYIDALLKEEAPSRTVKRERLRQEALAKLRRVYQKASALLEAEPGNTAALNVIVRAIREEAKLQGLYEDISVSVEHKGAVEIRVVYKDDWRGAPAPTPTPAQAQAKIVEAVVAETDEG